MNKKASLVKIVRQKLLDRVNSRQKNIQGRNEYIWSLNNLRKTWVTGIWLRGRKEARSALREKA